MCGLRIWSALPSASTTSAVLPTLSLVSAARNAFVFASFISKVSTTISLPVANFEASAERVVGTMPVAGNIQPYGLLHGGASCVLAETLGSLASALHAGPDRITVGIEISATHHRAATDGLVTGVTSLLYGGRTVTTHEIVITNEAGRRVCTSRLTCMLMDRVPNRADRAVPGSDPGPAP